MYIYIYLHNNKINSIEVQIEISKTEKKTIRVLSTHLCMPIINTPTHTNTSGSRKLCVS